ncbi:MAG: RagB/SusD family nutrient uptake outer membrane protein [Mangrovibacterium sp.]
MKATIQKTIMTLVVACVILTACNEDEFLKESPKDAIYADNVYINYTGFQYAKNALLALFRNDRTQAGSSATMELSALLWKAGTDNVMINAPYTWNRPIGYYYLLNSQAVAVELGFNYYFRIINSSNMLISRAGDPDVDWESNDPQIADRNKNEMIAYGRFARAWAYRFLVFGWGEVPISTEEISGLTYRNDWTREPVAKVKRFIINDLLASEPYLAEKSDDPQSIAKVVAQHYLAEMYISLYYDSGNQNTPALDSAYLYINKVVSNPNYALITNRYGVNAGRPGVPFMDQFLDGNVQPTQGNTEALWWFVNKADRIYKGTYENAMRRSWVTEYDVQWNTVSVLPEWGGRGIARAAITPWAFSIYEPQDHRFSEYAIRKYYVKDIKTGTSADTIRTMTSVPSNYKWNVKNNQIASTRKWDWTFNDPALYREPFQYNDQPYLRLAESYLLMAEILLDKGDKPSAAEWINKVRTRSHASAILSTNVTMDFILEERSRELISEEHRRLTLVRVGKLVERARLYNPQTTLAQPPGIQDFHNLFPIPQTVIDGNTAKPIAQNPGY